MSQLIQLRRHIKSIQTTKKITYAMRLISMSLYSKLERLNKPLTYYQKTLNTLFYQVMNFLPEWYNPILFPHDILDATPLVIFVASSKALCGSFNSNLIKFFKRYYFAEEHQKPTFITIGQKATTFIKEEQVGSIIAGYNDFTSSNFLMIAEEITNLIINTTPAYSSVMFFSNFFRSFFLQKPQKTRLIPVDRSSLEKLLTTVTQNKQDKTEGKQPETPPPEDRSHIIWEQSPEETLNYVAIRYLRSTIHHLLFQSLVAEQASRFVAMDNATTNAEKFLENLILRYNKSRQALITKEISELAASFE